MRRQRPHIERLKWVLGLVVGLACTLPLTAQIAMPDPSLIHGRAIPAADLPVGTVTVRVVRESIGNDVPGQEVRLTVNGSVRTATTDAEGRAEFPNLVVGANLRAEATVAGEALVSEPLTVPASGGLRVILVAGIKEAAARKEKEAAAAAAAPPVRGSVVFGPNTRVLMEFRDDSLQVFYVLDVVNNARAPVDIGGPLILDLPTGAAGAAVLDGSSPSATVSGDRITILGPFAPGATSVQVAFRLLYNTSDVVLEQRWPATVEQLNVGLEKVGTASLSSPQFSSVGEIKTETGAPFLLASGPALTSGSTLTIQLTNLPAHSRTPVYVALLLAGLVIATGAWAAVRVRLPAADVRRRLQQRRDKLMEELAALEARERRGARLATTDEARRRLLLSELEQLYGELDEVGTGPQGGGKDVAA